MDHSLSNSALRRQYDAAGFGGRVGLGARPALLVIDMAGAWITPGDRIADLRGVIGSILGPLQITRQHQVPVYFTTMAYGSPTEARDVVCRKIPHTKEMLRGAEVRGFSIGGSFGRRLSSGASCTRLPRFSARIS